MNYPVKIPSLHENFPPGFEPPALLLEFGDWLKGKPAGSLGYFCFQSNRFGDWSENGADLHPCFAFFLTDPTGGQIGYWLYEGHATASPPIVLTGSEGELRVLGDTLEEFLGLLAIGKTGEGDLDSREETEIDAGPELVEWLRTRAARSPLARDERHSDFKQRPDFKQWFDDYFERQETLIQKDPRRLEIADKLRKYLPANAEPWKSAAFDVLLVGTQFRMWRRQFGPIPMSEAEIAGLEPLFRALREERAREVPERGLWFSASVTVRTEGVAHLSCNFMERPKVLDEWPVIPAADYALDLAAFPRSPHWMPKWLEH